MLNILLRGGSYYSWHWSWQKKIAAVPCAIYALGYVSTAGTLGMGQKKACSLSLRGLGEELDPMQQNLLLIYLANKVKKQNKNRIVTQGTHPVHGSHKVLNHCRCYSDAETDAARQWYKQQHQNMIQLAAMFCDTSFNCHTIGSDLTLFPGAWSFWCASQSRYGWRVSACNIKDDNFISDVILMSLLEQYDEHQSETAFALSHFNAHHSVFPLPLLFQTAFDSLSLVRSSI